MTNRQPINQWLTKQALLGIALIVGGGVMLFGLSQNKDSEPVTTTSVQTPDADLSNTTPLTADIQTEERILEQKQREREARVATLEQEAATLLAAQQEARNQALKKAADEAQARMIPTNPSVQTRPEIIAQQEAVKKQAEQQAAAQKATEQKAAEQKPAEQKPAQEQTAQKSAEQPKPASNNGSHTVRTGDTLIGLSKTYGIPVSIIAAANNMGRNDALQRGRTIKIPSQSEVRALERQAAQKAAQEAAAQAAKEREAALDARLAAARQQARSQGANGRFGVQVALAANQANADALAESLKNAGYKVTTSQTNRGVRVVVGPERSREAAQALRSKIANDSRIKAPNAWVTELP